MNCRHIFQFPIPTEKEIESFYPDSYYAYQKPAAINESTGIKLLKHFLKRRLFYQNLDVSGNIFYSWLVSLKFGKEILKYPQFVNDGKLLDYGCGSGEFVALMQYLGWTSQGIDFSEHAVDKGIQAGLNLMQGDIVELNKYSNEFNCLTCLQTINHVPNSFELFKSFYKALKPNGLLIVTDGSADSASMKIYKQIAYYLTMPVHINVFSTKSIQLIAENVGFKTNNIITYNYRLSQAKSTALLLKNILGVSLGRGYSDLKNIEVLLGKFLSTPTFLWSLFPKRGDCILAIFQK